MAVLAVVHLFRHLRTIAALSLPAEFRWKACLDEDQVTVGLQVCLLLDRPVRLIMSESATGAPHVPMPHETVVNTGLHLVRREVNCLPSNDRPQRSDASGFAECLNARGTILLLEHKSPD